MHIVILGANGQLGSDLVKVCQAQNIDYTAVAQDDFDAIPAPSHIINCIATTNVDSCENNPELSFNLNASFSYKLAKFCQNNDITLFHISTDYVFDGTKNEPYVETDLPKPLNIYGLSKYAGDLTVMTYVPKYFIFRVASLFGKAGAAGNGGNFITTMQRLGSERESVSVIANQITCPTATLDIARAIIYFIAHKIEDYGIFNCVSSNSCSWYDFALQIFKLSALDTTKLHKADFAGYNFIAKRPQYGVMSVAKLSKYYKMPTWQESLSEYFSL
jgi:dTDP-4-dehydrorhamnose reductase